MHFCLNSLLVLISPESCPSISFSGVNLIYIDKCLLVFYSIIYSIFYFNGSRQNICKVYESLIKIFVRALSILNMVSKCKGRISTNLEQQL